jgi:phosphoglycolate phosphatase-like HAD superfamily hydrolase
LLSNQEFQFLNYPFFLEVKLALGNDIQKLNPILGIKEALTHLKDEGNSLGILTSNSEENVSVFLSKHGMEDLFSFIYSGTSLFGKHKVIRKFMKQNYLTPEDVIYVGDETRDIEASKKIHVKVIAVTWGFNSKEALVKHKPDFLIHQPNELSEVMRIIKKSSPNHYLG